MKRAEGKSVIVNPEWREKFDTIYDMLVALRKRLRIAKKEGAYSMYGEGEVMYCFNDRNLEEWFDFTREEILLKIQIIIVKRTFLNRNYYGSRDAFFGCLGVSKGQGNKTEIIKTDINDTYRI